MKLLTALTLCFACVAPVAATPLNFDTPELEAIGEMCDNGDRMACGALVYETNGQCAGPWWSGCDYNSNGFRVYDPEEPMIMVPGLEFLGYSRVSTVVHCAALNDIEDVDNMITDADLEGMEACLIEHE